MMKRWLVLLLLLFVGVTLAASQPIRVLVWSEGDEPGMVYPEGLNQAIAEFLKQQPDMQVETSVLDDSQVGLSTEQLKNIDVLIWFGHERHCEVPDQIADAVVDQVKKRGMGLIALHSSHFSNPFKKLLQTDGSWKEYRDEAEPETIQIVDPQHPIAKGVDDFFIPHNEEYVEPFNVPKPDAVIAKGVWPSGDTNREVMAWKIGKGRLVYIVSGDEHYAIYHLPAMQKLIINAVKWTAKQGNE